MCDAIGESIRSVQVGKVNSTTYNEVIIAGYSGRITSFTSEPTKQRAPVSVGRYIEV